MSQKYDPLKHQRQSIRLPEWDYRGAGYYFVTICTHQRVHLFADGDFYDVAYFAWQNIPTRNHAQQIVLGMRI